MSTGTETASTITDSTIAAAPDEVVTQSLLRIVALPGTGARAALITLDNGHDHTKPNTLGIAGLASLDSAIDAAETAAKAGQIVALAITGKPFVFAVGADLTGVPRLHDLEQARQLSAMGHRVFRRLGELPVPTFALLNGATLGGGLEIALHCTYRTVSSGAGLIAFPEVALGLVPGWGGAYLLPRLIGAKNAIKVIVENPLSQNRMLNPKQAATLGIADAMFEPADFLVQSLRWAAAVVAGEVTPSRPLVDTGAEWDDAITEGRELVSAALHGSAPAAERALDLIDQARNRTPDAGFAAEDDVLAELIMSDEFRASLYAFDLVQRRAKRPVGAPNPALARPITKVGIVGAGLMASQLALLFAQRLEVPVVMTDLNQERVDTGVGYVRNEIDTLQAKGKFSNDKANRLRALVSGTTTKADFADADLVIEAVFEKLELKREIFAELETHISATCLLLTNTSSLSVTEMSRGLAHPERVVGFHFFNPVAKMPLLEIASTELTDEVALATAFAVGKALKKSCVLVHDAPAFVVNRILIRFLGEVIAAFDEGTPFDIVEHALDPLGLPISPFLLLQLVGPGVALHVSETMHLAFPDRYLVSPNQQRIVDAGITRLLTWDGAVPRLTDEVTGLLVVGNSASTAEQLRQRALDAMAQEARLMLDDGVVAEPQDIDLCMMLGAGWPFHLGGITPYLDRTGTSERVTGRRFLAPGVASLPTAPAA